MRTLATLLLFASLSLADVQVFVCLRTDCSSANRSAPELTRVAKEFQGRHVAFYLVYPETGDGSPGGGLVFHRSKTADSLSLFNWSMMAR
jgi:hypothetical protein